MLAVRVAGVWRQGLVRPNTEYRAAGYSAAGGRTAHHHRNGSDVQRKRRILLIALAGAVVVALGGLLMLPRLVDVNRYRETIEAAASEALGQPVHLGTIRLSVWPRLALSVDEPTVGDPEDGERADGRGRQIVRVRRLDVGARLLPLLRGRLEVTGIILHQPEIVLRRHPDGTWNIADLLGAKAGPPAQTAAPPPAALPIEVEALSIRDARIVLIDAGWPEATGEFVIHAGADLSLSGDLLGHLEIAGTASLKADIPMPSGTNDGATFAADIGVTFTATISDGGGRIDLDPLDLDINGSVLHLRGSLEPSASPVLTSLTLEPSRLATDLLTQALAVAGSAPPLSFSSPQPVELSGHLEGGDPDDLLAGLEARLTVTDFTFRHATMTQPMEYVHGTVELRGESVSVRDFSGTIGNSQIGGELTIEGLEAPRVRFDLHSTRADFWELFSFASAAPAPVSGIATTPTPRAEGTSALDGLEARGTIRIDAGSFGTLAFTALDAGLTLDGHTLRLAPFRMNLYGGSFEGEVRLDLQHQPMAFRIESRLSGVQAGALLADTLDLEDALTGTLSSDLTIEGGGEDLDAIVRSLSGSGRLEMQQGRLGRVEVMKTLSTASGLFGEQSLARLSDQFEQEGTAFSVLSSDLSLSGPMLTALALRFQTPDMTMEGEGKIDLLAGELDARVAIVFSEELSGSMRAEKSRAASAFWDDDLGRVHLPLTLSGSVDAPAPGIDWGQATKQLAQRKVKAGLRSRLSSLLGNEAADALVGASGAGAASAPRSSGQAGSNALSGAGTPAPASTAPASATATGTTTDTVARTADRLQVTTITAQWSGSFLKPDLKLAGRVSGRDISTAELRVTDVNGQVIKKIAPLPEVRQYFDAGASPGDLASITWSAKISGSRLRLAKFPVTVTVVVIDTAGARVEKQQTVDR